MQSKIKEAALELFATKGYESTTIREIGTAVGIRGSSIYSHYKSKEEIFLIVVNDLFEQMVWEKEITFANYRKKNIELKSILLDVYQSYYHYFATNLLELMLWQRIRFFSPSGMQGKYDVNRLLNTRSILELYIELFQEGMKTKQLKEYNVQLMVMAFFVFISGQIDSLILIPFRLTESQLEESFEIFWDGIRFR